MRKYGNQKTTIDGITFDSKLEAERYQQLRLLEKAGEISALKLQVEFQILHGYKDAETGEKNRSRYYVGDFVYVDERTNRLVVEDTKGVETADFSLKWAIAKSSYPEYQFRKVTRDDV